MDEYALNVSVLGLLIGTAPHLEVTNGPWVLDHDHDAGTFRGWLCHKCNRSLGGFDDNLQSLKRAIDYLEAERD